MHRLEIADRLGIYLYDETVDPHFDIRVVG